MTRGAKVLVFGRISATLLGFSRDGKTVNVLRDDGRSMWTKSDNVEAVA
jgi:urease gamma subunit